jgi:putative ABC transport system permease protein
MWFNRRPDPRIDDELRFHRDRLVDEYMAAGMSRAAAERRAFLEFGNVPAIAEQVKDARGPWLADFLRDIRCAVRMLLKNPVFAMTAAGTLALAIGANTVMFSVLYAVVLRPLPYRSPDRLAMLWTEDPTQNLREGRSALWDVQQWRTESRTLEDVATFDSVGALLTRADGVEPIRAASISSNLLPLLGVQPVVGRNFSTGDAEQQRRRVLVSYRFWHARFGGSPGALGATLVINDTPSEIVGILPPDFRVGTLDADVWMPHTTLARTRGAQTWFVVARLRAAVTFAQAQVELGTIARRANDRLPPTERSQGVTVVPLALYLVGPQARSALWMLAGAVFFVFLIATANVTSLSLARSTTRVREIAVRTALGANAGRIVRQILAEDLLLAALSGILGTLLAFGAIRLIRAFGPSDLPRLEEVSLDLRVLGWAVAVSLVAGLVVGLAPAMTASRRDLRPSGEESGRSVSGGRSSRRIRRILVVSELALAIVLLVGAGLLVRSWWNVSRIDPGFNPQRVLMAELSTPTALNDPAWRSELYQRVLEQVQSVPGVESAGIIGDLFSENPREHVLTVERDRGPASERMRLTRDEVTADLFRALGTPLLRGRFFSMSDRPDSPRVALVNDAMARRRWPGQDPVGKRFRFGSQDSDGPWFTVVGVVADMRRQGLEREPLPQIFEALNQNPPRNAKLFIRSSSDDPLALAGSVRAAVHRVQKDAPMYRIVPLEEQLGTYLVQRRFETSLLASFSLVALLMAAVGIYGVIQYSIAIRTQEIGLRMAIGAQSRDIFRMVLGEGLRLIMAGVTIGLVGAWWLGRVASRLLFGVTTRDPWTFATVALVLTAVSFGACFFPAWRAMKVDPLAALRAS